MKTLHLLIIMILTFAMFIGVNTAFAQDVIGGELAPFIFHLDEQIMNGTDWSYLEDGRAAAVVMKGEGIELPLKIISATTEPVNVEFHASIGNEQVGHIKMPRGVVIQIEPKEILLKPDHDEMIKIKVKVDKNAPSNKYDVKLVGQWLGPNGFMGTSFSLHVGMDFGPTSIAVNFFPSPLKQTKDGVLPTEVVCTNDYVLVLKKSNNSPACVKPSSVKKLVLWNWALKPQDEITIEGFKDAYRVGEKIDFAIKFKGFLPCGGPSFVVKNAENKTVFDPGIRLVLCDSDIGYGEAQWKFGDLETLIINQTGSYTMEISVSSKPIERKFTVTQSQIGENSRPVDDNSLQCEQEFKPKEFEHTVFPNGTSLTVDYVPVFLMKPNSEGKICFNYWSTFSEMNYTGKVTAGIGKDNSNAQDVTVLEYPDTITIDSNKTIAYTIISSKESGGFYRFNPMFSYCMGIPIAIGYNSTHSFDNDFPWLWEVVPCPLGEALYEITGLTGIDVAYITKESR